MATNDCRTMFALLFLLVNVIFGPICVTAGAGNVGYQIRNANQLSLTSDANLAISFSKASASSRFKREATGDASGAAAVDGGAVNADDTNVQGNGSSTLPDDPNSGSVASNASAPTAQPPETPTGNSAPPAQDPFIDSDVIHDWHKYYESSIFKDSVSDFWVELQSTPKHQTLSDGHRVAVVIPLRFTFYFYGHPVSNVTVATGGFIYMSPFLHQWLTATQYIAPLMANFDPSFAEGSSIFYKSFDTHFIVEWRDVVLKDQNSTGKFSFQAILRDDSSITFVYKTIPVAVSDISSEQHPVKIGLSDAYYNDTYLPTFNVKKRTIYEYHKVNVPTNTIKSGTVVILKSLPTCNRLDSCDTCTKHTNVSFDCRWCNKIGRCSDGLDWFRQHWDIHGCEETNGKCKDKKFPVAVVVVVVLAIVGLVGTLIGWVYFAYTHPTSKSGMWLMEHRPSQIKAKIKFWKNSGDSSAKYKAESEA
ncbi:plexin domain-containing protein [Elysia marginata]|uniref:Plexin domain-containing protein n=1 Tax=Elysia marginata TaxID=1093978 RepID=A0AAV4IDI2_9GAST|nr:plexin domain-containing protein [Elysia marginata]